MNSRFVTQQRKQRTLKNSVSFSGIGIHTGEVVTMSFCPADVGTGVVFYRTDLPGCPAIPATIEYVVDTLRSTTIGIGSMRISTVEHVLAALRAYQIDNVRIELNGIEPPVADGSSAPFVTMIEEAGIEEQAQLISIIQLQHPVYWSEGDTHIVALPFDGYKISYTLSSPRSTSSILHSQFHSVLVTDQNFKSDIAPCRTFTEYAEISMLIDKGLIRGGSLANAVVVMDNVVLSNGGLRFSNEMARHKILDMIGDLSLLPFQIHAHILAVRAGHFSNFAFAQKLYQAITTESSR